MEKALEELSASALHKLLIEEVNKFIVCLDHGPIAELVQMKYRLRKIFDLIAEKEREENSPIVWGKNSTQPANDPQSEFIKRLLSDQETGESSKINT
jgi:hypothetical protein